jgi:hypothetical protein
MYPEGSLPCSQGPATEPHPEPTQCCSFPVYKKNYIKRISVFLEDVTKEHFKTSNCMVQASPFS